MLQPTIKNWFSSWAVHIMYKIYFESENKKKKIDDNNNDGHETED